MKEEITLKDIKQSMEMIMENEDKCLKCNTTRNYVVCGILGEDDLIPLFCKCESDRLCKTDYVKHHWKVLKEFIRRKSSVRGIT